MYTSRRRHMEHNWVGCIISFIVCLVILGIAFYAFKIPFNIHSHGFWAFTIIGLGATALISLAIAEAPEYEYPITSIAAIVVAAFLVLWLILSIFSSKMVCANIYKNIAQVDTEGVFEDDVPEIKDWNDIPVIDKITAEALGDRGSMGNMEEYLSQYEVSNEYNLIAYKGGYYRVSPLMYGSFFKYMNSKEVGIPAYVLVDVYTGEVELVELENGQTIRYAPSACFGENLTRHIRKKYPTAILGEANFEINDEGTPYYIVSILKGNAGVFGAPTIDKVLLVNAVTGEIAEHTIDDVPDWVDNVYDVTRIMEEIDWKYSLINGYFNFSQKQVRKTSYSFDKNQYYAIPMNGHVYIYTGVTSAGADESNIGFLLINMRNGESTYYSDPGAEESSAQESAKGVVQQFNYAAGPAMLVNINGEQTYFLTLKDNQNLIRMYALVNKTNYALVVVEDSIEKAVNVYCEKLNLEENEPAIEAPIEKKTATGVVTSVYEVTVDGNTMFIFYLEGKDELFVSAISNSYEQPAKLVTSAKVTINYTVVDGTNVVNEIKFN